jgi:hypothetical protein
MTDSKYKLASIDKKQIAVAARKALMAADAHYYSWPMEKQEHFRTTMTKVSCNRVRRVLLDNLLGIKCSKEEVDEVWDDLPLEKVNMLNWASLLTEGIGEDFIYLNESLAENKSLLDFTTLYDYDYGDHLFQEEARHQDSPNYEGADYYAYRHPSWVRLLIDERFYYATFTSLATYFSDEIEAAGNSIIDQLIPHEYVDGKNNGKPVKGGFLWDMKLDAGGQEGQFDELRSRWYAYLQERWLTLSKIHAKSPATVYTQNQDWDDDPHRFFIFNNEVALKKIRWRHFLSDCKPLIENFSMVTEQLEQEINSAKVFLAENHQDILANFDPSIVKFRKKRKIIMTAGALDDLNKPR